MCVPNGKRPPSGRDPLRFLTRFSLAVLFLTRFDSVLSSMDTGCDGGQCVEGWLTQTEKCQFESEKCQFESEKC